MTTADAISDEKTQLLPSYQNINLKQISFEDDTEKNKEEPLVMMMKNKKRKRNIPIASLVLLIILLYYIYDIVTAVPRQHHDHTIPTLLSVRSTLTSTSFMNSLSNTLYHQMKLAGFESYDDDNNNKNNSNTTGGGGERMMMEYDIGVNKDVVSFHDNLTITWDFNVSGGNDDAVNSNSGHNVIALYCPASEIDAKKFRDAATVHQIRNTNLMTETEPMSMSSDNQWFIPSFPIIRENDCEVRLWIRGHNDYHSDEMGSQVANYKLGGRERFQIQHGKTQPTTIHLALTADSSEMIVQFSTGDNDDIDDDDDDDKIIPIVVYHQDRDVVLGENINSGLQLQQGNSTTYKAEDMCQKPAIMEEPGKFSSPGMLHSVKMMNLEPNTKYHYRVGIVKSKHQYKNNNGETFIIGQDETKDVVWSKVYTFYSPLPTNSPDSTPFTFLVYADQGTAGYGNGDGGKRTSLWAKREIRMNTIRSVHHIGDLSYAQGVSHIWDKWLDMVSVFSTSVPLMIGVGNHEYDHTNGGENGKDPSGIQTPGGFMPDWGDFGQDSNGECGVPVSKRFTMPETGNGVFWYSYDSGNVHTIMISSEHDLSPKSDQYKWLEAELSAVNRTLTPWVIVESHRPLYHIENIPRNTQVGIGMRNEFENLLFEYNVDLFLSGHYHSYMRSCSGLYQSKCNNGGPIHITVGTAGAELDNVPLLRRNWVKKYIVHWGYGRITSLSNNELRWEFISDTDGTVEDQVLLRK